MESSVPESGQFWKNFAADYENIFPCGSVSQRPYRILSNPESLANPAACGALPQAEPTGTALAVAVQPVSLSSLRQTAWMVLSSFAKQNLT